MLSPIQEVSIPTRTSTTTQFPSENASQTFPVLSRLSTNNPQYRSLPLPTTSSLGINQENENDSHDDNETDIHGLSYIHTAPMNLHDIEKTSKNAPSLNANNPHQLSDPTTTMRIPLIKNRNIENDATPTAATTTVPTTPIIPNPQQQNPTTTTNTVEKPSPVFLRSSFLQIQSSSSFEIESQESTSSPVADSDVLIQQYPHHPPFDPLNNLDHDDPTPGIPRRSTTNSTIRRHQLGGESRLFHDQFLVYVEDRYVRYRPLESQHNNDMVLGGTHPFQQENYGRPKSSSSGIWSITSWFRRSGGGGGGSRDENTVVGNSSNGGIGLGPDLERQELDVNRSQLDLVKKLNLKPNSSRSIIPSPMPPTIMQDQGVMTPIPVYTPKAIPVVEYPLNFEKPENENLTRRNEIENSLDEEVRNLIDGRDNFLTSCFEGIWSIFVTIGDFFVGLY